MQGHVVPNTSLRRPRLLGGSSKLARLAEERRKKAATSKPAQAAPEGALSSLDRLSRPKETKENETPQFKVEPKKYPIRKKKEPSPPPREPTPPPEEKTDEMPDLRASPTDFGRTLSTSPPQGTGSSNITLEDVLGSPVPDEPFEGPSPDDTVLRAQQRSKALNK